MNGRVKNVLMIKKTRRFYYKKGQGMLPCPCKGAKHQLSTLITFT